MNRITHVASTVLKEKKHNLSCQHYEQSLKTRLQGHIRRGERPGMDLYDYLGPSKSCGFLKGVCIPDTVDPAVLGLLPFRALSLGGGRFQLCDLLRAGSLRPQRTSSMALLR